MIDENIVIKQFVSYCWIVLKYEKINYYREQKYREKHEVHLEMLGEYEVERLTQITDTYNLDSFEIMGYQITVDNEHLDQALMKLPEKYLRIVLMYYFIGLNDVEIGKIFDRSRSTICGQRHKAIKMLHSFMEDTHNG